MDSAYRDRYETPRGYLEQVMDLRVLARSVGKPDARFVAHSETWIALIENVFATDPDREKHLAVLKRDLAESPSRRRMSYFGFPSDVCDAMPVGHVHLRYGSGDFFADA